MSNGNCTHYARTNFIICAHEVNGSSRGQRQASFFFTCHRLHTHLRSNFPSFNLCILMRQRVVFFCHRAANVICVWANTCREAINTTQRPKSYKLLFSPLFLLLFFRIPNDTIAKKKIYKIKFSMNFSEHYDIYLKMCVRKKKHERLFIWECVLGTGKMFFLNFVQRTQFSGAYELRNWV